MKYISTRDSSNQCDFTQAMVQGLANDGGLFVPQTWPKIDIKAMSEINDYAQFAQNLLQPFLAESELALDLEKICRTAFDFKIPLVELREQTAVLELFHGPTAAFKDVGARFLAGCMQDYLMKNPSGKKNTVLVATSGDTGGAVAAAFYGMPNLDVKILFPAGRISPRQEKQLTAWGGNVFAFAVQGTFDDCQKLVKETLLDADLKRQVNFISANSINIGRILPQMVYYAFASSAYFKKHGAAPGFIIPSGNLGNSLAAVWAQKLGFPISQVVLATNANSTVLHYAQSGRYVAQSTVATLANAMDVGNPSNMERYLNLFSHTEFTQKLQVFSVDDQKIKDCIRNGESKWGQVWCPHTAVAVYVREQLKSPHWIVVATAHPAKFESIVEPLIGHAVPVPQSLEQILKKPSQSQMLQPDLAQFRKYLL